MKKLLSIIIPTYNMERYLSKCLESVTATVVPDSVEVIVVNDGSKDNSLSIAQSFQAKRSDIVEIVNKGNGNYGSCINVGLTKATGKYVKVLDADDWFNTEGLVTFLSLLKDVDADLILTDYTKVYTNGRKKSIHRNWSVYHEYDEMLMSNSSFLTMQMHAVTYRTALLRDMDYRQTERISYTDQEWIFYPMRFVRTIRYFNIDLYQYLLGREGQTMDAHVMQKNVSHGILMTKKMIEKYAIERKEITEIHKKKYLDYRINSLIRGIYKLELLCEGGMLDDNQLNEFDNVIKKELPDVYQSMDDWFIHNIFRLRYIRYYHVNHAKASRWVCKLYAILKMIQSVL